MRLGDLYVWVDSPGVDRGGWDAASVQDLVDALIAEGGRIVPSNSRGVFTFDAPHLVFPIPVIVEKET